MSLDRAYLDLGALDMLSYKETALHRLDPRTKVIAAFALIAVVASFPKYEVARLIPFFLFPAVTFYLGRVPVRFILKKVLLVSAFAVLIGLFNPLLDTRTMYRFHDIAVSGGWVSFVSILLKALLTTSSALLLISVTSFPGIAYALRKLGIPGVFASQLLFLYRYLFVLAEEAMRMARARDLRSFGKRGRGLGIFINVAGTLFVRTMERAGRIYNAMLSRGFTGAVYPTKRYGMGIADVCCLSVTGAALLFFRACDPAGLAARLAARVFGL